MTSNDRRRTRHNVSVDQPRRRIGRRQRPYRAFQRVDRVALGDAEAGRRNADRSGHGYFLARAGLTVLRSPSIASEFPAEAPP